jgi:hypothetical protein
MKTIANVIRRHIRFSVPERLASHRSDPDNFTWAYANGVVTASGATWTVAAGGRVLIAEGSDLESDSTGFPDFLDCDTAAMIS